MGYYLTDFSVFGERMHDTQHFLRPFFFALIALALPACSGGGGSSAPAAPISDAGDSGGGSSGDSDDNSACNVSAQIDFVESVTDSWYLWYDEMATVNKADYDSAQAYLDARLQPLLDDGRDKGFSYMTTITEDETNISSGAYVGFGFRSSSTSSQLFIIDVFESGPAYAVGVRRGMVFGWYVGTVQRWHDGEVTRWDIKDGTARQRQSL